MQNAQSRKTPLDAFIARKAEIDAMLEQVATAEVLEVINASPGNLAPVFGAMLEGAVCLCSAAFGMMSIHDGRRFRTAALPGVPPELMRLWLTQASSGTCDAGSYRLACLLEAPV